MIPQFVPVKDSDACKGRKIKFRSLRILSAFLALLLLSTIFCSCTADKENGSYDAWISALSGMYESEKKASINSYRIILGATDSTPEIYDAAKKLADELSCVTDTAVRIIYDWQYSQDSYTDIFVGAVSLDESYEFIGGLRTDDYGFRISENSVFISGHCAEKTILALEAFGQYVSENGGIPKEQTDRYIRGSYALERASVNGFELNSFIIVYPKPENGNCLAAAAENFRERLSDVSGYYLRVACEDEIDGRERAIYYGYSSVNPKTQNIADNEAHIAPCGHNINIGANTSYGLACAAESLCELIRDSAKDGQSDARIPNDTTILYDNSDVICTSFRSPESTDSVDIYARIMEFITYNNVYTASFGEMSSEMLTHIMLNLPEFYAAIDESTDVMCPVLYRKDTVTCESAKTFCVGGGTAVAAEFRRLSDGFEYVYINAYIPQTNENDTAEFVRALSLTANEYARNKSVIVAHNLGEAASAELSNLSGIITNASLDADTLSVTEACNRNYFVTAGRLNINNYSGDDLMTTVKLSIVY